ncbi:hypothetical protein ACFE04_027102 [Oxalis oulophora]
MSTSTSGPSNAEAVDKGKVVATSSSQGATARASIAQEHWLDDVQGIEITDEEFVLRLSIGMTRTYIVNEEATLLVKLVVYGTSTVLHLSHLTTIHNHILETPTEDVSPLPKSGSLKISTGFGSSIFSIFVDNQGMRWYGSWSFPHMLARGLRLRNRRGCGSTKVGASLRSIGETVCRNLLGALVVVRISVTLTTIPKASGLDIPDAKESLSRCFGNP